MSESTVGMSAYRCNTRTAKTFIADCLEGGVVPFLKSSPGMGKSSIMKNVAREYGLKMIDHRLSTSAPEDLTGLPRFKEVGTPEHPRTVAEFAPFEMFPTEHAQIPGGHQGWMLFLDEFNSAPKSVQAAAYKLILDKEVGQNKLHQNVVLTAAGNLSTDRAIVNPMSTAMQSRVVHLEMELVFNHWLEDVAIAQNWDPRIIAYLTYKPSSLHDFRPDHNESTFACPRTWEFINRIIKGKFQTHEELLSRTVPLAGAITSGVALEFIQFTKVFEGLPKIKEILADPLNIPVPQDTQIRYATVTYVIDHVTDKTFEPIAQYIARFTAEFQTLFYRFLLLRQPTLRSHPAFAQAMLRISKYLND